MSNWILIIGIHLLCQQSIAAQPNRLYGDVSNEDTLIDNLENVLRYGENPNQDEYYPTNGGYESVSLKIPFAVRPTDPRYYYPTFALREASLHSNVYGHDSLSPESRNAIKAVWDEDAQRHQAYIDANYPKNPEGPHENPQARVGDFHGHYQQAYPEEVHVENAQNAHLETSKQHVQQLPHVTINKSNSAMSLPNFYFVALVSGITATAVCTVVGAGICYFRLHKSKRDAAEAEYPAYGVTGPNKELSPGAADRKLAQSAHMFHYQHQKQQMIALEKSSSDERHCSAASDVDSEEDGEEGDYTVYECPGLAPTSDMEVKNPAYSGDPTPGTPSAKESLRRDGGFDDKDDE